jgi:hypothetical protein
MKLLQVLIVLVMIVGSALIILFPTTAYDVTTKLTEEEKQAIAESRPKMPGLPMEAPIPEVSVEQFVERVPLWVEKEGGKKVIWFQYSTPAEEFTSGVRLTGFLRGALFQVCLLVLICTVALMIISRLSPKKPSAVEEPADETRPSGEAPDEGQA